MIYDMTSEINQNEVNTLEDAIVKFQLLSQFSARVLAIYVSMMTSNSQAANAPTTARQVSSGSGQQPRGGILNRVQRWLSKVVQKILNLVSQGVTQVIAAISNLAKQAGIKSWHITATATPPNISVTLDF